MRKPSDQRAVKWLLVWCSAVAVMTTAAQPAPGQTWEAPSTVVTASDEAMINMAFNNTTVCGRGNDGTVHVVFTISSWLSAFEIATFPETATSLPAETTVMREEVDVYYTRKMSGEDWSVPIRFIMPGKAIKPSLSVGPRGGLIVVWIERETTNDTIYATRSNDGGSSWTDVEPVHSVKRNRDDGLHYLTIDAFVSSDGSPMAVACWLDLSVSNTVQCKVWDRRTSPGSVQERYVDTKSYGRDVTVSARADKILVGWDDFREVPPGEPSTVSVFGSDDLGETWNPYGRVYGNDASLCIARGLIDDVYLAFHRQQVGRRIHTLSPSSGEVVLRRSTDGGRTFAAPEAVSGTDGVLGAGYFAVVRSSYRGDVAVAHAHTYGSAMDESRKRFGLTFAPHDMEDPHTLLAPLAMPGSFQATGRTIPTVSVSNGYIDVFWLEGARRTLMHRAAALPN